MINANEMRRAKGEMRCGEWNIWCAKWNIKLPNEMTCA